MCFFLCLLPRLPTVIKKAECAEASHREDMHLYAAQIKRRGYEKEIQPMLKMASDDICMRQGALHCISIRPNLLEGLGFDPLSTRNITDQAPRH